MIEKNPRIERARWVDGDLGVHFVYTAGIAGEEFLRGLAKGKVLASTCDGCSKTYCPCRMFCEDCFQEIKDRHEVDARGTIVSLTRLEVDENGAAAEPRRVGAIRLDGTDTTILHHLEGDDLRIGDVVEARWATKKSGSIRDIDSFRAARAAKARAADSNGERVRGRRVRRAASR